MTILKWLSYSWWSLKVGGLFQKFCKMIETWYKSQVQVLHSDNEGEYMNQNFNYF